VWPVCAGSVVAFCCECSFFLKTFSNQSDECDAMDEKK
jgi:hypothetical protein